MKITTLVLCLLFMVSGQPDSESENVHICVSPYASKYHFDLNCKGLANCKHEIKKVNKEEAKKLNYTVCFLELQ